MAQIIKDTQDPFHDDFYICSNCHNLLFTSHVFYKPVKTEQDTMAKIVFGFPKDKHIPNLCPKCLEPLEFPNIMEIPIYVNDTPNI